MTLTGKTIGELAQLSSVTEDTLFAVEYSGKTFNLPYSAFSPTYKVYTALLTQSGTDAPVATVLENTLGDIVWTRDTTGQYLGTLTGAFISGKTVSPQFPALTFEGNGTFIPISANGNPQLGWVNMYCQNTNSVNIDTYDMVSYEEWSIILGSSFLIEIRVYN